MWKYQEILNADIYILLAIGLGIISVALGIFQRVDMRVLNAFVFKILLPIAVINGLGLKSDLRDPDIWKFIGAFLVRLGAASGRSTYTAEFQTARSSVPYISIQHIHSYLPAPPSHSSIIFL